MPHSVKVCTKCGADIWPGERYCSECGVPTKTEVLIRPGLMWSKGRLVSTYGKVDA